MALSLGLVAGGAIAPPGPTVAATPAALGPCQAGWQEVPIAESAFYATPFEVVVRKGKPAWVLGGTNEGVLVLKWTGSRWRHVAKASKGHRGLVGGVATTDKKVLAAGYERPLAQSLDPLTGKVVAGSWRTRRTPDPSGPRASLADIVNTNNGKAWAVGTRLYNGRLRALAMRWNGKRWIVDSPGGGIGSGLLAVERTPGRKIWAVGWRESSAGRPRPLIAKRTSKGWKTMKGPTLPAGTVVLTDVDFRADQDGWAVGYVAKSGADAHRALLLHWNGSSWKRVAMSWADDFKAVPRSISVGPPGELWIGGTKMATDDREVRGFLAHLADGAWAVRSLGVPSDVRSEIHDIAATADGAVAVGTITASSIALQTCEETGPAAGKPQGRVKIGGIDARRSEDPKAYSMADSPSLPPLGPGAAKPLPKPTSPKSFTIKSHAAKAGLDAWTSTFDGLAADIDGNGWGDIFYSRHGRKLPALFLNGPKGFKRASGQAFSIVDRHGCDSADIDKDGARDILCAVGGSQGKEIQRHELSLAPAEPDGRVARASAGIADPFGRGRRVGFIRLDDDAYPEVFITNGPARDDSMPGYNRFYRNKGGTFVPAPGVGLDRSYGGKCIWTGDIDRDGDEDLAYCTHYKGGGKQAGIRLMRNEGGKLRDRTTGRGITPIGDIDVRFADVTGDDRKDLIQLSENRIRISKWTPKRYKKIWERKVTGAIAMTTGDVNGDGRADIYIVRDGAKSNAPDRLLVSLKRGTKYTSIKMPQAKGGSGDDVVSLDWDKNGLTDFVVFNGRKKAGPVQLLASYPAD
jgi:hypothetical protein